MGDFQTNPGRRFFGAALGLLAILACGASAHAAPLRVCTFSFNAPNEVDVFKKRLPARDFEIIDLSTRISRRSPNETPASRLLDVCRTGLQCDIVVYSAEFAGRFFGERGTTMGIHELEEASCQPACRGLFEHPAEVFLLGCNTLATKDRDNRTPEEYREVLLKHGFDGASAEHAVQLRYGPLGPSFRQSVRRIFAGVPRIYGFKSVAPRAQHSAHMLNSYFRSRGDYARYLAGAKRDTKPNRALSSAYTGTHFAQITGLQPSDPAARDRQLICSLYDETLPVAARLRTIERMTSRDDFLGFVPSIKVFLARHAPESLGESEQHVLDSITRRHAARDRVLELVRDSDMSAVRMDLAQLALQLRWMPKEEFRRLAEEWTQSALARPLTSDVVDITCEVSGVMPIGRELDVSALPDRLFRDPEGLRLVDCLSPADRRVDTRLVSSLDNHDAAVRVWAAYALSRRLPLADSVLAKMARHVDDPSAELREGLRGIFAAQGQLSNDVRSTIADRAPLLAAELAQLRRKAEVRGGLVRPQPLARMGARAHEDVVTPVARNSEPVYALEGAAFRSTR